MKRSLLSSLKGRMLVLIGSAVGLGLGLVVSVVTHQSTTILRAEGTALARTQAESLRNQVAGTINESFSAVRALADGLATNVNSGQPLSRAAADAMLRGVLARQPQMLGLWTVWEPNAFDGRDADYANREGTDATGRYIPYWNRGDGKIVVEALQGYDTAGAGDYYQLAKKNNHETILEPYLYKVGGRDILMTSLVVPVHNAAGAVIGAVGCDLDLAVIAAHISQLKVGATGYAALVSNTALYVGHPKLERCGKPLLDTDPWAKPYLENIRRGEPFENVTYSHTLGTNSLRVGVPLIVGGVTSPWAIIMSISETEVLRAAVTLRNIVLAVGAVVLLAVIGVVWLLAVRIVRPINAISSSLQLGADQTASAAVQVSGSSQQLAAGASQQAASLEETSASLEEIASMTKRNAESAAQAKDLANQTRSAAESGSGDVQELGVAMDAIKQSSDNIAKIIKTIDEIAFQTNILALNAAVEAARAGEAGAGFAVVADEVRSLAQRSAVAARETADRIQDAIAKGEHGVAISRRVATSLGTIVEKARGVDTIVAEIATASSEQNQGLAQVTKSVSEMDKVTQSNAANAEESASASEELSAQAELMRESVNALQQLVSGSGRPSAARAAVTPRAAAPAPQPVPGTDRVRPTVVKAPSAVAAETHGKFFN